MHTPEIHPEELAALQNEQFFRLKSSLDDKVKDLFTLLKERLEEVSKGILPSELSRSAGRLYQGENHHGFPWRALDQPHQASKPDLFIFRCLLLWGHQFSFHLILNGSWKDQYFASLSHALAPLGELGFFIDSRPSAWEWFLDPSQLYSLSGLSQEDFLSHAGSNAHLKLTLPVPLDAFSQIPDLGAGIWEGLSQALFLPEKPR